MKQNKIYLSIALTIGLFLALQQYSKETIIDDVNLLEATNEFDYNSQNIQLAINEIKGRDDMEKLRNTLKYISSNVMYDYDVSIDECYKETASIVLAKREGDCVSKARLAVALLRGQGIQSRTTGGCVQERYTCSSMMAAIQPVYEQPIRMIKDNKKRGYLHEWVEVIIDNKIYLVDPTSGAIFENKCGDYNMYAYDTNQYDRCVISSQPFIDWCYSW